MRQLINSRPTLVGYAVTFGKAGIGPGKVFLSAVQTRLTGGGLHNVTLYICQCRNVRDDK